METLAPWLLLAVAGLGTACVVLYVHLRQLESAAEARRALAVEELREAEAALQAAAGRIREDGDPSPAAPWQPHAVRLAARGLPTSEIAREVGVTAGEVEVLLALSGPR